jgi:hypothetical protein
MKFRYLPYLFFIFLFIACNSNNNDETESNVNNPLKKTSLQPFTDTVKLDTFNIELRGKEAHEMELIFNIVSHNGIEIYKKVIKADELLKGYLASEDLKREAEKIKFLKNEVNFFFDDEHFLVPAVTPEESPDNNVPDKAFYNELKQTQLNGFDYRLNKDAKIYIAWSKKEQKVKVYYKCC